MRATRLSIGLEKYADIFFMLGLSMMVIGGFMLAMEFEHF